MSFSRGGVELDVHLLTSVRGDIDGEVPVVPGWSTEQDFSCSSDTFGGMCGPRYTGFDCWRLIRDRPSRDLKVLDPKAYQRLTFPPNPVIVELSLSGHKRRETGECW